jgi:5-methylcytosine-specific restriction endonuclease McrA
MRDYRKAKPDVIARAEAKRDKEKRRADAARLRDSNRPRYRAYSHEYRSRAFQAEGTHTAAEIEAQIKHQKCKCYYCGASLKKEYHVDHVRPLTRGGRNSIDNLVLACAHCNLTKSDRLPHEWPEGGRLL